MTRSMIEIWTDITEYGGTAMVQLCAETNGYHGDRLQVNVWKKEEKKKKEGKTETLWICWRMAAVDWCVLSYFAQQHVVLCELWV